MKSHSPFMRGPGVDDKVVTQKVLLACLATVVIAGLLFLFFFDPARVPIFPVCTFHKVTGLDCPACGSLRAMHQLMNGNIAAAFQFNPVLVLSIPVFAWLGVRLLRRLMRNERGLGLSQAWIWIYVGVWLVFGIVRNLPSTSLASITP